MKRRSASMKIGGEIELGNNPMIIRGYDPNGKFTCRLQIAAAGLAIYAGPKGNDRLANVSWEELVKKFSPKKK